MKRVKLATFAATALLALTACSGVGGGSAPTNVIKVAAVAVGPFTAQFNPLLVASQNASGYSMWSMFEPLMMDDFVHGRVEPWLVTSYSWGDDGRALTLNLRDGLKWSDGTALTAQDVAFTFELLRKNAGLNINGLSLAGASAPTATQAVIKFSVPAYQMMWWLTTPVPKHLWESVDAPMTYSNPKPVGSGPYRLKSFTSQAITLERNPYYWQAGLPKIPTLQFLAYDSDSSMIAALQDGQVDWVAPGTTDAEAITKRSGGRIGYVATKPNTGMVFLLPNNDTPPTNEAPVRKAISQALDRKAISELALSGQNEPAASPTGLDSVTRADKIAAKYKNLVYGGADVAAARATLTATGYKMGPDGVFVSPQGRPLNLDLKVPTTNPFGDWVRASEVIVKQLAAAGIKVTIRTESQVAWRDDVGLGNFQLSMRSIGGTLSVFDMYNRVFSQSLTAPVNKKAQRNYERYRNPNVESLLAEYANAASGSAAEQAALGSLQDLMVNDVPVIPLFFTSGVGMWRTDRFTGWPNAGDPYALSLAIDPNAEQVLLRVAPRVS